jgi:hypothetical protein
MAKPASSQVLQIAFSRAVTASDTVDIPSGVTRALLVATDGAYSVVYENGNVDNPFLIAGIWHPMRVARVRSTGSVATTGIKAGY